MKHRDWTGRSTTDIEDAICAPVFKFSFIMRVWTSANGTFVINRNFLISEMVIQSRKHRRGLGDGQFDYLIKQFNIFNVKGSHKPSNTPKNRMIFQGFDDFVWWWRIDRFLELC
jgi:hypothetical protein